MTDEPANLPAMVQNQGGALVSVLSWAQYLATLSRVEQTKIGIIVRAYPDLNSEAAVDLLADVLSNHAIDFDAWFEQMLEENGIETISMALELLHAYSVVGGAEELMPKIARPERAEKLKETKKALEARKRRELEKLLEVIGWVRELGHNLDTFEHCDSMLDRMGGWEVVRCLDYDTVQQFLNGHLTVDDLRELADAPHESADGSDDEDGGQR